MERGGDGSTPSTQVLVSHHVDGRASLLSQSIPPLVIIAAGQNQEAPVCNLYWK